MFNASDAVVIALLVLGFVLCFLVSVGIGANDLANAFSSAYGSGSLNLLHISVLSSIFETLGAVLIGMKVSDTIRKGIVDLVDIQIAYNGSVTCMRPFVSSASITTLPPSTGVVIYCAEMIHMIGSVSILFACSISLFFANLFKLPASATHIVVGSTLGYALVALEGQSIKWIKIAEIAGSWVLSPVSSGILAALLCFIVQKYIVKNRKRSLALLYIEGLFVICVFALLFSIFFKGSSLLRFDRIPEYGVFIISIGGAVIAAAIVRWVVVPLLIKHANRTAVLNKSDSNSSGESIQNSDSTQVCVVKLPTTFSAGLEYHGTNLLNKLLTVLQVMTACNKSFAHGGNDVSNSVAPMMSIYLIYTWGSLASKTSPSILFLLFGAFGMIVGLSLWGKRVLTTIGKDITTITPASGFAIEFSSSSTVLFMTHLGLPVSTTHCTVGSTVSIAWLNNGFRSVKIRLLLSILICWIVSIPIPAAISAGTFTFIRYLTFNFR